MQAKDVICKGARWRVEDGSSIDIRKHRWLDSSGGGKILSPWLDLSLAVVKDLFITGTKMWNSNLIDQNFYLWEAERIKSLPVSLHVDRDLLIWPWTPDGVYSDKSAYQILANDSLLSQAGPSNPGASKPLWNGIWKLKAPNKVKHFMWRASNESLPTKNNLCARHVLPDSSCGLCEEFPKDVIHCLWLCDHVKCIWLSDQTFHYPRTRNFRNFGDLVSFVLSECSSGTAALFSMVAWCIWTRRNKLRERQPVWDVGETVKRARELLQEFTDVQDSPVRSAIPRMEARWKPPGAGLFKINFDGAVFVDRSLAGLGIVICDELGLIIVALSQKIPLPSLVELVEALAVQRALIFTQEISIFKAEMEGDSLKVIQALNNPKPNRTQMGHIICDIQRLGVGMQSCTFNHTRRGGNRLAHSLAKRAVLAADTDVWLKELPQDLVDVFQFDLS